MDDHEQIEEIIREIASKHGIAVSRDDPILILQTINNRLLQDSAKAQRVMLDQYKEELEALAHRWGQDSKGRAERILNAALVSGKAALEQMMGESTTTIASAVASEIDTVFARLARPMADAYRIALLNVVAAGVTFCAAVVVLWAILK